MTKVEAIEQVMKDNGGTASLSVIYENICKYYPMAKQSKEWEAGLRGVLYREIKNNRRFKKIGLSIYAVMDYQEEKRPRMREKERMHSYIEGICLELGNFNGYYTYTADPTAKYRDNLSLCDFATVKSLPDFSYKGIVDEAKRIDVIWLNKKGFMFPNVVLEVVDSIGTLNGALNRSLQLKHFMTDFIIVAPEKHHEKFDKTLNFEIYQPQKERFKFFNYDEIMELYEHTARKHEIEKSLFGLKKI